MIGVFDYTVILTYLSLISAGTGIFVSLSGNGHPFYGAACLLISAILDAFDGKVARTKKDRTDLERGFGIQIDSLTDVIAFGVLPACIGYAMIRRSPIFSANLFTNRWNWILLRIFLFAILIAYVLAAVIRLAYYNVTEEERQQTDKGNRRYFIGVPVTTCSFIFPIVITANWLLPQEFDLTPVYFLAVLIMAFLFVSNIRVPKITRRGLSIMIAIGAVILGTILICNIVNGWGFKFEFIYQQHE